MSTKVWSHGKYNGEDQKVETPAGAESTGRSTRDCILCRWWGPAALYVLVYRGNTYWESPLDLTDNSRRNTADVATIAYLESGSAWRAGWIRPWREIPSLGMILPEGALCSANHREGAWLGRYYTTGLDRSSIQATVMEHRVPIVPREHSMLAANYRCVLSTPTQCFFVL